ncbi:MAG: tRNA adenosine deaminase-associated protein [Candidatus Nanopelagicales bacterium]|nr:tRNA adenosine deaminase-associated protein [Candidatus Nanopelagicales bacterium]
MDDDAIDFVVAAWQEEGRWMLEALPPQAGLSVDRLINSLAAHPSQGGVLGLVSIADDFFVIARVQGRHPRFLLSDVSAGQDWPIAEEVLDRLGIPIPNDDDDDFDEVTPAGDMTIVADWGMSGAELTMLCEDIDMFPDEVLSAIATRLGFGPSFDAASGDLRAV